MIPKGNQRAGGVQLATHLLNAYDNDSVEVAEVRGAIAQDLHGAFAEWYAESKATLCRKYLYSLSINPDHRQGPFTRDHYYDFIRRTEDRLGLLEQPRAVVFHVKHGREHCHVVWSRIDTDKMRAVQLSQDHQKLRAVAQEYARDHNLILPPGMRNNRGKDRFPDHAKTENLAEKQQEERTGVSKKQRMEQIAKAWRESSDARSFVKAIEDGGYTLAGGDQRPYVVVDLYGEIHSLSRQLIGVKSKELKSRLAAYPIDKLQTVAEAQTRAREKRQALLLQKKQQERARDVSSPADHKEEKQATARERRDALAQAHALRRAHLEAKRQKLAQRHSDERKALADLQTARSADIVRDRAAKQPKGVLAFLARITGFNALAAFRQSWQDKKRDQECRLQSAALARRHGREMENFRHQESGLTSLEKRERRSLETGLRRDAFRALAAPEKARPVVPELTPEQLVKAEKAKRMSDEFRNAAATRQPGRDVRVLTPEQRVRIAEFKRTAAEISAPATRQAQRGQQSVRPVLKANEKIQAESEQTSAAAGTTKKPPVILSGKFNEAARSKPAAPPETLSAKFNEKAEKVTPAKTEKIAGKKQSPPPPETTVAEKGMDPRLRDIKENAADISAATPRALDLAKAFRERAGQTRPEREPDQESQDRGDTGRERHYRQPPPDYSFRR
jgi:hypothetical protein